MHLNYRANHSRSSERSRRAVQRTGGLATVAQAAAESIIARMRRFTGDAECRR